MKEEKQIIKQANELLDGKFIVKGINNVNYALGHPYTIGAQHIKYASDHFGGMLGESAITELEKSRGKGCCCYRKCTHYYNEHTSDKVMFLSLTQNLNNEEAGECLKKLKDLLEENKIDGISLVETPEKYRITN